jgi:hypothetical protein
MGLKSVLNKVHAQNLEWTACVGNVVELGNMITAMLFYAFIVFQQYLMTVLSVLCAFGES